MKKQYVLFLKKILKYFGIGLIFGLFFIFDKYRFDFSQLLKLSTFFDFCAIILSTIIVSYIYFEYLNWRLYKTIIKLRKSRKELYNEQGKLYYIGITVILKQFVYFMVLFFIVKIISQYNQHTILWSLKDSFVIVIVLFFLGLMTGNNQWDKYCSLQYNENVVNEIGLKKERWFEKYNSIIVYVLFVIFFGSLAFLSFGIQGLFKSIFIVSLIISGHIIFLIGVWKALKIIIRTFKK